VTFEQFRAEKLLNVTCLDQEGKNADAGSGRRLLDHRHARAQLLDLQKPKHGILNGFSFDTVVCSNGLEHVREDQAALACLFSLLDPGGRLVLAVPASNINVVIRRKLCSPKSARSFVLRARST
jgi:2-polyprenyl-3-methyl-5-hydroxy-6-metoxy-1,4-benzoquinol methylase